MKAIALQFINGNAFFAGIYIVSIGLPVYIRCSRRIIRSVVTIMLLMGVICTGLSGTPFSLMLFVLWVVSCAGTLVLSSTKNKALEKYKAPVWTAAVFMLLSICLFLFEIPYHMSKEIIIGPNQTVYVLGDSISAGFTDKEKTWPLVLGELSGLKVINLALPGATVKSARVQADGISIAGSVVILEIGGIDILEQNDTGMFETQLAGLLSYLEDGKHTIVMFEIPTPPLCSRYGKIQRTLAEKYHVTLIPKKYMADVIGMGHGTIDSIHLSQKGHNALAESVYELIRY